MLFAFYFVYHHVLLEDPHERYSRDGEGLKRANIPTQ